jgi:hypothetical protein
VAFDIYAGTFVRFYTRDWENVVQKQARLDGTEYRMIYAGGDAGPPAAADVSAAVDAWKEGINAALALHGLGPIDWSESADQPYFTDRPSWGGYAALQLWAAHLEKPELPVPYLLPETPTDDPALAAALASSTLGFRSILQGGVWLPGDFDFLFQFPALTEGEVMIGSTGRLLQEIRKVRSKPLAWAKKPFFFGKKKDATPFQEIAEWALPVFEGVVEQGHAAGVPFMLSF